MMTTLEINNLLLVSVLKYWHITHQVNLFFFAGLDDDLKLSTQKLHSLK